MNDPRGVLRRLADAKVRFVTFGSTGIALLHPTRFRGTRLTDVDVLLASGMDTLLAFVHFAERGNATVTSWGEPFDVAHRANVLRGRFYVRARFDDGLQLDATYESDHLDGDALIERAVWVDDIPVCPEEELWFSKYLTNSAKTQRFALEHGLEIPPIALERAKAVLRVRDTPSRPE